MINNNKHRWTFEEDQLCCKRYLEYYVINKSGMDVSRFIMVLQKEHPSIKPSSLKMKVQNIKQILIEKGIKDTLDSSPLANYSQQNMRAMDVVLQDTPIKNEMKGVIVVDKEQTERIEHFMMEIAESEEYKEVAYLAFSIRMFFLEYISHLRTINFVVPPFLTGMVEYVSNCFEDSDISPTCMLEYMNASKNGWVYYFDIAFLRPLDKRTESGIVECDRNLFILILTGFIIVILSISLYTFSSRMFELCNIL